MARPDTGVKQRNPAILSIIGGLGASLIVVIATTWASAEAQRAEALLQERRAAYADLIGSARSCATAGAINLVESEMRKAIRERTQESSTIRNFRRSLSLLNVCFHRLQSSGATVSLLADSAEIRRAAHEVVITTVEMAGSQNASFRRLSTEQIDALSHFEVLARESSAPRVLSPLVIGVIGLGIIWIVIGIMLFRIIS